MTISSTKMFPRFWTAMDFFSTCSPLPFAATSFPDHSELGLEPLYVPWCFIGCPPDNLTYPHQRHVWRWCSFSQHGICLSYVAKVPLVWFSDNIWNLLKTFRIETSFLASSDKLNFAKCIVQKRESHEASLSKQGSFRFQVYTYIIYRSVCIVSIIHDLF